MPVIVMPMTEQTRPAPVLSKTVSVLDRAPVFATSADEAFAQRDEDHPYRYVPGVVRIERQKWRDFGCPDQVTVTIEPGDRLNDDPAGE